MALLLPDQKAIFLHVPKTGGLFIEHYLRSITKVQWLGNRHSHMRMIGSIAYDKRFFKFCFLRKPSDWYQSYWQMKMGETPIDQKHRKDHWFMLGIGHDRGGIHQLHHPTWDIDPFCGSDDLNEFVKNCSKLDGYLNNLYKEFVGWGFAKCDFVGEFDNLIPDLKKVLNHLDIKFEPKALEQKPKYNPSKKRQQLSKEVEADINYVESYYFGCKKGFI